MKSSIVIRAIFSVLLVGGLCLAPSMALADDSLMGDPSDIAAEMQAELGLSDEQTAQMNTILTPEQQQALQNYREQQKD
jgi:hypothetical protein